MRLGQNPAKSITDVYVAKPVTVAVITFIPFLEGYYRQALDVLKVCLASIRAHTDMPFDLMVFDNASCQEVVDYLVSEKQAGNIQFLMLSEKNVGKVGGWNWIFGAAPGEHIAYSDSDVYYHPNWLSRHMEVFRAFDHVGTVGGLPRRGRRKFYTNTLEIAGDIPGVTFEEGKFIPDEWIVEHARSLGKLDTVDEDIEKTDYRLTANGIPAYATATHFQFMVRSDVIRPFIPFVNDRPMGTSVAQFDNAINSNHLLRLAVSERAVQHIGNTLDPEFLSTIAPAVREALGQAAGAVKPSATRRSRILDWKPIRFVLLRVYDWIFRMFYGEQV